MNKKTIAITGANGFIGSNLKNRFLDQGYHVRCFQRSMPLVPESDATYIMYDLNLPLSNDDFLNTDILIHCAFIAYSPKCKNADDINTRGTQRIIEMCLLQGIKMVFLSSFSAHIGARSHYGTNKLLLENMFDAKRDLIFKLGLVVGNGGMFYKMKNLLDSKYLIPLIDNGKQLVQTIGIHDLLEIFNVAITQGMTGKYNIAENKPRSLKEIFFIIRKKGVHNLFVPIPSNVLLTILKITERIGIFLPFSSESVLGLKCNKVYETINDLKVFGIIAKPLKEIIIDSDL